MISEVLVGVVTWDRKAYCYDEFKQRLNELSYTNYDVVMVDTTPEKRWLTNEVYHSEGDNSRERITNGYNKLREIFLNGDYEYLMIIESDIIPPKHIIESLMEHDKDVCCATYMIGRKGERHPCLFKPGLIKRKVGSIYIKMVDHHQAKELDGDLWEVKGMSGMGCHLIKRKVLEKLSFHHGVSHHCDAEFHNDLHKEGIEDYIDTGILCKHYGKIDEWLKVQHENDF